jgi:hypothetical protein
LVAIGEAEANATNGRKTLNKVKINRSLSQLVDRLKILFIAMLLDRVKRGKNLLLMVAYWVVAILEGLPDRDFGAGEVGAVVIEISKGMSESRSFRIYYKWIDVRPLTDKWKVKSLRRAQSG